MICQIAGATVIALLLTACGELSDTEDQQSDDQLITVAESFVDAFYSFEPDALRAVLATAKESIPAILFYQGWAEGGNYEVMKRMPCKVDIEGIVNCAITVRDDLIGALGIDFHVTDTFHLAFRDGQIVSVSNSSNDPQAFYDANDWVEKNRQELIEEPCKGFFDGGLTPGDCVRAMVQGYSEFAASYLQARTNLNEHRLWPYAAADFAGNWGGEKSASLRKPLMPLQ